MSRFIHLHVHTQYSLLDGLNKTADLFSKVKEYGMDSVAITDHGVLYGVPEFWKLSKDFGIKPIIGCEAYLAPGDMSDKKEINGIRYYHLLLLAKNDIGYRNLVKLVTKSHLEGMYYKPRIDLKLLKKHSEGLICTSACLAGPLSRHILRDELDKAEWWLNQLHGIFKDDFYLEIQRNGIRCEDKVDQEIIDSLPKEEVEDQLNTIKLQIKVNKQLYKYSDQNKIPIIASTDAHYLNKEDKNVQKVLFCIRDGRQIDDPNGLNGYVDTYIKSPEELAEIFSDIPEVLEETLKIGEKIEPINLKPNRVQPHFWNIPKGSDARTELAKQTYLGAQQKYGKHEEKIEDIEKIKQSLDKSVVERLEYELMVIDKMGYNDYFLVVGDLMQFARKNEIVVGVRGSAAGSLVAYCLNITNVDPLKWGLVFERFLNLERASPPDIDMDIQDDRREELIDYAREKYGKDAVAGIITFGRMATRAAIRDVARVMGIDLATADKLSKKVIVITGKPYSFEQMMDEDPEFREIVDSDPKLQQLGEVVKKIENLNRHTGVHAAGYLITPGPVDDYMALQRDPNNPDLYITQMDGTWIDKLDFMKFDFLGLRTLTILKNAIIYIEQRHGVKIDLSKLNVNPDEPESEYDKKAFEVFQKAETTGVFQFESPPMQKYLRELHPTTLGDICFMAAAYRPGPMQYIPDYISIKNGRKDPNYLIPELEPILRPTLGFPVYQEQLLEICMKLGGFTLGEGDYIRNALKKKQLDILKVKEEDFKKYFLENYEYGEEVANEIWKQLEPFASYGFNKAHAASYAVVAYWCAYLKGNYPLEFMTSLMHSDLSNLDRIVVDIKEAKRLGFDILPPDINKSDVYFQPEGENGIRFGLGAIKNVGIHLCESIVQERNENGEYKHLDDLIQRVGSKNINKRAAECLIMVGAMDSFGDRNALLSILPEVFEKASKAQKAEEIGQADLFSMIEEHNGTRVIDKTPFPEFEPATDRDKLAWEKDLIGIYITTHPLQNYSWTKLISKIISTAEVQGFEDKKTVQLVCTFSGIREIRTKTKNERMAFVTLEDQDGTCEGVIFPRAFADFEKKGLVTEGRAYLIEGKISVRDETRSVVIEKIEPANALMIPEKVNIDITDVNSREELEALKRFIIAENDKPDSSVISDVIIKYGSKHKPKILEKKFIINEDSIEILRKYMK